MFLNTKTTVASLFLILNPKKEVYPLVILYTIFQEFMTFCLLCFLGTLFLLLNSIRELTGSNNEPLSKVQLFVYSLEFVFDTTPRSQISRSPIMLNLPLYYLSFCDITIFFGPQDIFTGELRNRLTDLIHTYTMLCRRSVIW